MGCVFFISVGDAFLFIAVAGFSFADVFFVDVVCLCTAADGCFCCDVAGFAMEVCGFAAGGFWFFELVVRLLPGDGF